MRRIKTQKVSPITPTSEGDFSLAIGNIPAHHIVERIVVQLQCTGMTRTGGQVHEPEALLRMVRSVEYLPGNSKAQIQVSEGHRLGLMTRAMGYAKRNYQWPAELTSGKLTFDIPLDPMPGTKFGKQCRPFGAELNGSELTFKVDVSSPFEANDFVTMDVRALVFVHSREPDADHQDTKKRIKIKDQGSFEGDDLTIKDHQCIGVLLNDRSFTECTCTVGDTLVYKQANAYALDGYDAFHRRGVGPGGSTPTNETDDHEIGYVNDIDSGTGSDTTSTWTKLLYFPNQQDLMQGNAVFGFTGLPEETDTPYISLGLR